MKKMIDLSKIDYSQFDRPEILMFLFHPRPEWNSTQPGGAVDEKLITVEEGVVVGARFYVAGKTHPNILFFHGNGEIVADYSDLGELYNRMGINFLPVDYRGYGRSTGKPTVTAMMRDAHVIFDYVQNWLRENDYGGSLIVMGRSLGSASALEISAHYGDHIDGLIVESGFAEVGPLFQILGINMEALGVKEEEGFRNIEKIRRFKKPALIIHAENDHIIPFHNGQMLYDACEAGDKSLLKIPGANHNDIFLVGISEYMKSVKDLVNRVAQ